MNPTIYEEEQTARLIKVMNDVLRRHTWMKDGETYVGNGTYTLKEAQKMMEQDYPSLFVPAARDSSQE